MDKIKQDGRAEEVYRILAQSLRRVIDSGRMDFSRLQEIRLRVDSPCLVVYEGTEHFIDSSGRFTGDASQAVRVSRREIRETLEYISNYSMYAFDEELRQGYITVQGGHRIGVAGKIIWEGGGARGMRHISFLNIRLAHEVIGCSDAVLPYLAGKQGIYHTLIISPPRCGKTTLLRDLIRQISNGNGYMRGMAVGVVDERSELGACYMGVPQNDLGCRTDILDACPKVEGMMMLVRSMAPQVIAVDEAGSAADVEAMEYVMNCGVHLIATVHGNSIEDIKNKPVLGRLLREKMFERYVLLQPGKTGKVQSIFDERGSVLFSGYRKEDLSGRQAC